MGAELRRALLLGWADSRDHARAAAHGHLRRDRPDAPRRSVHQHDQPVDGPIGKNGPVAGDSRDPKAGRLFGELAIRRIAAGVRQRYGELRRHDYELGRCPERAIRLRAIAPDGLPDTRPVDALADRVDCPGPVAVRNDPGKFHPGALPTGPLLDVP